ncbi:Hypothetical protein, putative [Bodo saltans]|uniref:Uncharacterized protein n=1 Tax=Bodo saltans TaxID=75058 RepID=A0A0S4INF5_BODSA|nr:Hypothetical protein, putative [Bodo saltans]|eukprot:CUF66340.1 Hypothetical protein, putative [Bodo saltans]
MSERPIHRERSADFNKSLSRVIQDLTVNSDTESSEATPTSARRAAPSLPNVRSAASREQSPEPLTRPGTALGEQQPASPQIKKETTSVTAAASPAAASPRAQQSKPAPVIMNKRPSSMHSTKTSASKRIPNRSQNQEQPRGPPLPKEVEKLTQMSARERVEYGYRLLRESNMSRGTAAFTSNLPRDPYNLREERINNAQQAARKRMEESQHNRLVQQYGPTTQARGRSVGRNDVGRSGSVEASGPQKRSSSWARDTTPRGNYMFNWTNMPQCIPRNHIDPTPGPGAYTPLLHYVGGTH